MNDFDLENELYAARADETERLGPPALDLDRVRRVARRRRVALTGSGAATALAGVAVAAVALGGFGGPSGSSPSPSPAEKAPPSGRLAVTSDPTGCDQMLRVIPPLFTGTHKTQTLPPAAPVSARGACRTVIELPPYQRTSPPHISYSGVPLLPPSVSAPSSRTAPSPTPDGR